MINFVNSTFVKSIENLKDTPTNGYPEVLFVGKSNVGKSSLINLLTNKKRLAFTSSKPGHTRLLNYYNIDNKLFLVDAPGYGYAQSGINLDRLFKNLMDDYFKNNINLKLTLVLIDSRRELSNDDVEIINYLIANKINYALVFTKSDKTNQKERAALLKHIKEVGADESVTLFTSSLVMRSVLPLRKLIEKECF